MAAPDDEPMVVPDPMGVPGPVGVTVSRQERPEPTAADVERVLAGEGMEGGHQWGNAPGDTYGWHRHDYHKVLYCLAGGITFHTAEGDVELAAGDRLELTPGTDHAATVGPAGVRCMEALRRP